MPDSGWTVWCRNLSEAGGRLSEGREWDSSLCLAPRPQFLSTVLWVKMRWEPQKTLFGGWGGNCRWQMCVKHMCNGGFSPASARNDSLFLLSSHVSRSVSPTTTSQIQARKKRRGVSLIYVDQGAVLCLPGGSGWSRLCARAPRDILCVQWGAVGTSLLWGHSAKSTLHRSLLHLLRNSPPSQVEIFCRGLASNLAERGGDRGGGERFHLGLSHQSVNVSLLSFCTQNIYFHGPVQSASLNLP